MLNKVLWIVVCGVLLLSATSDALEPVENFAKATLIQGYGSGVTTVVVTSGQGARFPSTFPYRVVWYDCSTYTAAIDDTTREIVLVTNRSTDTFTLTRAQEGTLAVDHNTGGKTYCIEQTLTKAMWESIDAAITAGAGGPQDILNMISADLQPSLADANASAVGKTLRITNTQTATADITFAASTRLWIPCPGKISWTDGLNVNFDRPEQIVAGDCQIFDAKVGVHFTKPGKVNPKWWGMSGDAAASTNKTGYDAMRSSLPAYTAGVSDISIRELYQVDNSLESDGKNAKFLCNDDGSGFVLTTSATNRHLLKATGNTSHWEADRCVLKTSSTIVTDLTMKAISMDVTGSGGSTAPAGSKLIATRNTITGFNIGSYCDGGASFTIEVCHQEWNYIKTGGAASTGQNEGAQCHRVVYCSQTRNRFDGDSKSEHGIYNIHPLHLEASGNTFTGYVWEAVKVLTHPTEAGYASPRQWRLDFNTLKDNAGSVAISTNNAYSMPMISMDHMRIDGDSAVGSNPAAVMIVAGGTSKILNFSAKGLEVFNATKGGVYFSTAAGALLGRMSFSDTYGYNWSTSSALTYAFFSNDSGGTKEVLHVSGRWDGNSNGRNVFGVDATLANWGALEVGDVTSKNVAYTDSARPTVSVGGSITRANIMGTNALSSTLVQTAANTSATNLSDVTIKANSFGSQLSASYQNGFHLHATGTFATNTNTKTLRLKFGSTTVVTNDKTTAPNGTTWIADLWVWFRSAGVMVVEGRLQIDCVNQTPYTGVVGEDETTDLHAIVEAQNGTASAGDIKQLAMTSIHLP